MECYCILTEETERKIQLGFFLVFVVICFYFNLSVCSYLAERIEIEPMKVKKRENELDKSIHKPLFFGKQLMQKHSRNRNNVFKIKTSSLASFAKW